MKKTLSLILALALLLTCMTVTAVAEEPTVITVMNRVAAEVNLGDDNPILQAIEEKLNIDLQYDCAPSSSYNEKEQLAMASGEMPDILYHHAAADVYLEQWAEDGLILALDEYLPKYENITSQLTPQMQEAFRSNTTGYISAITRPHVINKWGFQINKTWLDNLNLEVPTTMEELKNVLIAFAQNDPDGNGLNDTYGTTIGGGNFTDYTNNGWASAFGLSFIKDDVTGEYNTIPRMSGYMDYLTFFRELNEAGALDPEWILSGSSLAGPNAAEKLYTGKVGLIMEVPAYGMNHVKTYGKEILDNFISIAPMKNIYTGEATFYTIPPMWGCYMINAECDHLDKVFEFIDYCYSPEGWTLLHMGVEGIHYNSYDFENRTVDRTPEQAALLATHTGAQVTFCNYYDGKAPIISDDPELIEYYWKEINAVEPNVKHVTVPYVRAPGYAEFDAEHPDANTHLHQYETQYIMGEIDEATFKAFLENEYYPVSEEMNASYSEWLKAQWEK